MNVLPHNSEAIQGFIRTLSRREVIELLDSDPLGGAFLDSKPQADESEQRWQLFDILLSRPAFFFEAQETKCAVELQVAAQLALALEVRA